MAPQKERAASAWLIAERARCRLEGLLYAKDVFTRLPWPDAKTQCELQQAHYEAIIKDPKPTGVPGE